MPLDIPQFLRLTPEQRKKAWDDHRLEAKPLPPEVVPAAKRISLGAKDDRDA
jgi:hypothetical protein